MKRVLLLSLAIMMVAGSAMADRIGIYTDEDAMMCAGTIAEGVPVTVYVVHVVYPGGSIGSQFKVQDNTGLLNTGVVVNPDFLSTGQWNTGISLAYTYCVQPGYVTLMALSYVALTPPGECLEVFIVPDPAVPEGIIKVVHCDYYEEVAAGGRFFFNSDTNCPCEWPTAVEPTTWGRVKSLYR